MSRLVPTGEIKNDGSLPLLLLLQVTVFVSLLASPVVHVIYGVINRGPAGNSQVSSMLWSQAFIVLTAVSLAWSIRDMASLRRTTTTVRVATATTAVVDSCGVDKLDEHSGASVRNECAVCRLARLYKYVWLALLHLICTEGCVFSSTARVLTCTVHTGRIILSNFKTADAFGGDAADTPTLAPKQYPSFATIVVSHVDAICPTVKGSNRATIII